MKHSFCEDWEFTRHWTEAFGKGLPVPKQQAVRLPHTCREVPLHYATPADYEMVCGYRKRFRVPPVQAAPRLFLRFDGAAHQAVVRVNGRVAGQHRGGYTGFAVEITDLVDREGENLLTVQLDTREDPAIPPFGFVIDYLTYGGLCRSAEAQAKMHEAMQEVIRLANLEGVPLPRDNDEQFLRTAMPTFNPDGMPSMRQDVLAKRPTEVEEFAGVVRARAKKYGMPTPANDFFYARIQEIEAGYCK